MPDREQERAAALGQLNEVRARQAHNQRVARAREHVGAAGWAQNSALEKIIHAGQEQLAVTDALRQVVSLTLAQLRQVPLSEVEQFGPGHSSALKTIVESGGEQVDAATALKALIQDALAAVVNTPLNELNLAKLEGIHAAVQDQLRALHVIIDAAKSQARTLAQLRALDAVSAEQQARVTQALHQEAETKVRALEHVAGEATSEIGQLARADVGGRLSALEKVAGHAVDEIVRLDATPQQRDGALRQVAERALDRVQEPDTLKPRG